MAKWIRKVNHGLTYFRVSVPMVIVRGNRWLEYSFMRISELPEGNGVVVTRGLARQDPRCSQWIFKRERGYSGYLINIPGHIITSLKWESCRYVTIESAGDNMLIIRRMPGDKFRKYEGTEHTFKPDRSTGGA